MSGQRDERPAEGAPAALVDRHVYEFGPFLLRASDRALFRASERIRITPRVLDLLLCLVEDAGRIVSKERLLDRVWEGTFVEEGNVNRTVSTLRRILEETDDCPYIETIPRQGYRFVAPVIRRSEEAGAEPERSQEPALAGPPKPDPAEDEPEPPSDAEQGSPPTSEASARWAIRAKRRARLLAAALALALAVAAGAVAWSRHRAAETPRSIAILPFRFSAGAANGETLAVALADAVIARLSRGHGLTVRPTTAVLRFRDGKTDSREAGRQLDVDAVLDGTVAQVGGRTSIAIRLLRTRDGEVLLFETFRTGGADIFELQDRVAERVAAALVVTLAPAGEARRDAARLAATELLLRGRLLWSERSSSQELKDEATSLFRRAIEADPDFALAYVGLADALLASSLDNATEAEEAARRALGIDDRLGPAHATLGTIRMVRDQDWAKAGEELSRALELEPSYVPAWQGRATLLALHGRMEEARRAAARAVELDPTSASVLADAGLVSLWAGRLSEARGFLERARSKEPHCEPAARLEQELKDEEGPEEARRRALESLASAGVNPGTPASARPDRRDEFALARLFAVAGQPDAAIAWLGTAVRERRSQAPFASVDPAFRPLRSDPRFAALLRAMGLAPS
ncbi:MAG TPA: winged helix-turn-helix domain-containing protein [Thermoanaerobaculia bacterium]|nr:winged helix-turn-helix domain-containing protein [Thermoanaerobaculia bacterium]